MAHHTLQVQGHPAFRLRPSVKGSGGAISDCRGQQYGRKKLAGLKLRVYQARQGHAYVLLHGCSQG
jgi:hypothetical protein